MAAAIARKKPNDLPILSNACIIETADKPSSPMAFEIQIVVIIPYNAFVPCERIGPIIRRNNVINGL